MEQIQFRVLLSASLCSLVAGMLLAFAIAVMTDIRTLGDLEYIEAY